MGPRFASEALRLIAENIDLEDEPSVSAVASDLREVLQIVEGPDGFGARVAILDTLKGLKRKIFNTKGERKILEKIDKLKSLQGECARFVKEIRRGLDFSDMAENEKRVAILLYSAEFMQGGSAALEELSKAQKPHDVIAALGGMDEYYDEEEDDEESDRKILADAVSDFYDKSEGRIDELEKRVDRQRKEQKKGGRLKRDDPSRREERIQKKPTPSAPQKTTQPAA